MHFPPTTRKLFLTLGFFGSCLAPAMAAGDIQIYQGDPLQAGRIRAFTEGTGAALPAQGQLRGLYLLPLEYNGRLEADTANPDKPHLRDDISGVGRIELPGDGGVLYHYGREVPGITRRFGYLLIDSVGGTQLLAERLGTGSQGADDPYGARIALAPDGRSMLLTTTLAAGGNLLEVDLANGQWTDRSANLAPLEFLPHSLRLQGTWAVAVTTGNLYRTTRGATDQLTTVTLEAGTVYYSGTVVMSEDGTQALTTAGVSAAAQHVWVFDQQAAARRASRDAGPVAIAGYLPEVPHGPFYALDNDGDLCAWCSQQTASNEVFLRRASSPATQSATQITSSTNFTDTLDEAGVLNMFQPGHLTLAIGEQNQEADLGIEKADFFEVTLDASGVPTIVNITGTSGEFSIPYLAVPQISPKLRRWLPAAQAFMLFDDRSSGAGRLAAFDPNTSGEQVLLADVKEVFFIEPLGDAVLISLRMDTGSKPHQLVRMPADLSTPPVVILDTGDAPLIQPVVDTAGWIAFREVPLAGLERIHRYHVPTSILQSFFLGALSYGPVLAWTGDGDLTFSLERAGQLYFAAWKTTDGGLYRIQLVAHEAVLLPGH